MSHADDLLRLVYVSRNLLPAAEVEAEIETILAAARRRNPRLGVTGSLFFSEDCFAQALEGPPDAVESLFELIQMDPRDDKVVVLEAGKVAARQFSNWSMGYAGRQADPRLSFAALTSTPGESGGRVGDVLRGAVLRATPTLA